MRQWRAVCAVALALAWVLAAASTTSAKVPHEPADCPPLSTHLGAESLFAGLPDVHFPRSVRLAGQRVRIDPFSPDVLLPGDRVSVFPEAGFLHPHHPTGIHATIGLRLARLDPSGVPQRTIRRTSGDVDRLGRSGTSLRLKLPNGYPARYRLTMVITNRGGSPRRYGENVVVPVPSFDPRMALNSSVFHVGQAVRGRMQNFGSILVSYGYDYGLQRLQAGAWVDVPTTQEYIPAVLFGLYGGGSGECESFEAKGGFAPGHYRAVKQVGGESLFGKRKHRRGLSATVTAEFDVVP